MDHRVLYGVGMSAVAAGVIMFAVGCLVAAVGDPERVAFVLTFFALPMCVVGGVAVTSSRFYQAHADRIATLEQQVRDLAAQLASVERDDPAPPAIPADTRVKRLS